MAITFGIIVFPGSNCDHDAYHVAKHVFDQDARFIWHKETSLHDVDVVVVPGGFSYGDYIRSGAIARLSPIMRDVVRFAERGGLVFGICNGFQILCEIGLLPGALMRNASLRFACKQTHLLVENAETPYTTAFTRGDVLQIPISHGEGNYYASEEELDELEQNDQVVFRYCDEEGHITEEANPNGSARNIAGITSRGRNVLGMMPHPDRCAEPVLGRSDGAPMFESILQHFEAVAA